MSHDPGDAASSIESRIRELLERDAFTDAASVWLDAYGPEILTFLGAFATVRDEEPSELFSCFCEALLLSLPHFRWECTARTWSYRIARSQWCRALRRQHRRRTVPLSDAPAVWVVADRVRSSTAMERRTSVKDAFQALREELPYDDRMLLVLRVDRGLDWTEAARVMAADASNDEESLARTTARLRKRFQRIKRRIRTLAQERGLLTSE